LVGQSTKNSAREERVALTSLDCAKCGACCREAYHVVELDASDPFIQRHTSLLVLEDGRWTLPRPGGRCVCLTGDGIQCAYQCDVYEQRPVSCAEFEPGGENCIEARARVGLR